MGIKKIKSTELTLAITELRNLAYLITESGIDRNTCKKAAELEWILKGLWADVCLEEYPVDDPEETRRRFHKHWPDKTFSDADIKSVKSTRRKEYLTDKEDDLKNVFDDALDILKNLKNLPRDQASNDLRGKADLLDRLCGMTSDKKIASGGIKQRSQKKRRKTPLQFLKESRERQAAKELAKGRITAVKLGVILECSASTVVRMKAWKKRDVLKNTLPKGYMKRDENGDRSLLEAIDEP